MYGLRGKSRPKSMTAPARLGFFRPLIVRPDRTIWVPGDGLNLLRCTRERWPGIKGFRLLTESAMEGTCGKRERATDQCAIPEKIIRITRKTHRQEGELPDKSFLFAEFFS